MKRSAIPNHGKYNYLFKILSASSNIEILQSHYYTKFVFWHCIYFKYGDPESIEYRLSGPSPFEQILLRVYIIYIKTSTNVIMH